MPAPPIAVLDRLVERLVGLDDVAPPVLVGCSGGPDSLALLALACAAGLEPVATHVDHGSRPGSDTEAEEVATRVAHLGARFRVERVSVAPGANYEARARDHRYRALERARESSGASAILVGHTADDQAETVLLNVLRGSASTGLGAMAARRDRIVRPLLRIRRAETEALCAELGLDPRRDPSNEDLALRRNWVRHVLLPELTAAAGRDLVPLLTRQAEILREESEYLDSLALAAWPSDGECPAGVLTSMPGVLARRAVRRWIGPPPPSHAEVERVLGVARGDARATEVSGGRRVWRGAGRLHLDAGRQARRGH